MVEDIFEIYWLLWDQARKALLAKSTLDVIAHCQRRETCTNLYLHPMRYTLSRRQPHWKALVEIPLPYASSPQTLNNLAISVDTGLMEWLKTVVPSQSPMAERVRREVTSSVPSLQEELRQTFRMTAV